MASANINYNITNLMLTPSLKKWKFSFPTQVDKSFDTSFSHSQALAQGIFIYVLFIYLYV